MLDVKTVILPTDFSGCSLQALPYAWEIARAQHAELVLAHSCSFEGEVPVARQFLWDLEPALAPLPHRIEIRVARAVDFLIGLAEECENPLIVMGTRGQRGANRRLLGSTAEGVVSRARCPVLTVKGPARGFLEVVAEPDLPPVPEPEKRLELRQRPKDHVDLYFQREAQRLIEESRLQMRQRRLAPDRPRHLVKLRTVLVPIDFSERSRQAAMKAHRIASEFGGRMLLLHVSTGHNHDYERQVLGDYAAALGADFQVEHGSAPARIVEVARDRDVDLIVLATRGRRAVAGVPLGSTARTVVRRAPCPVLTLNLEEAVAKIEAAAGEPAALTTP